MSPFTRSSTISLIHDQSLWRFEKVVHHKWQEAPRPYGGVSLGGILHRFKSHRYMILNIDGHELEIAAVYQNRGGFKGTDTVCHLDSSYVGSNGAMAVNNGIYGAGSIRSLIEGSGRFMYLEVGGTLVGVSSPRIIPDRVRNTSTYTRTYPLSIRGDIEMINPIVQVWSRVKPRQRLFVGSELIELKKWSPSKKRFLLDYEPRYWLGGPEKKSEPCGCYWCSNRLKRFGSSGTAKSNKNPISQVPPHSYYVGKTKGGAE